MTTAPLNDEQNTAALTLDGPVLVSAGAGSGKTRMLTERFINAIVPGAVAGWSGVSPDEVVAITFTDKAAGELVERVRAALRARGLRAEARELDGGWISTIHGLCSRILKRHALEAGLDPLFGIVDTVQAGALRVEAFEGGARDLLEGDPAAAVLFDIFGFDRVFSSVQQTARELATRGLGADDLLLEPAPSADEVVRELLELIESGADACSEYVGNAAGVMDYLALCTHQREACAGICSTVLSDGERLEACMNLLEEHSLFKSNTKGLSDAHAELKAARERLVGRVAAALAAPHAAVLGRLVAGFSARYAQLKADAGMLDFDDLQTRAVELLERRADIAARYAEQFKLVMIDEFQDTDALQLRLVRALGHGNLCTVGDEKQSIYRFRGADVDVYQHHAEEMRSRDALVVELDTNYRSHPDILGFVNDVFGSDEYFGDDLMRLRAPDAARPLHPLDGRPRVEATFVDSTRSDGEGGRRREAEEVATRLGELAAAGIDPGDMAVLVRRYRYAHVYADALSQVGLTAVIVGGSRFFELAEVALMRALVRVVANPNDDEAFGRVLASDIGVSDDALALLGKSRTAGGRFSLWAGLSRQVADLANADVAAASCLIAAIDSARRRVGALRLGEVLVRLVEETGLDVLLLSRGNTGRDALANVLKVIRQADAFEANGQTGPAGFAAWLDAKERFGEAEAPVTVADDHSRAVRIMSVHASKGLEFPVVAVVDLGASCSHGAEISRLETHDDGLRLAVRAPGDRLNRSGLNFSHTTWFREIAESHKEAERAEENRVLYVAFTRARDALLVSGSYKLSPKSPPRALNDLLKLARLLEVGVPVAGESDEVVALDSSESCRVRVLDAGQPELAEVASAGGSPAGGAPPRCGQPLPSTRLVDVTPGQVSYSHLDGLKRCGRRFYYESILGVPAAEVVSEGASDPRGFGSAVHSVLQLSGPGLPDAERMRAIARQFELGESEYGCLVDAAGSFVRSATAREAWSGDVVRREAPFSIRLAEDRFSLGGVIDLYSKTAGEALIVDYKTGTSGNPDELRERYRLQAECYALAAIVDGASLVHVVFSRPEVIASDACPQEIRFEFVAAEAGRIESEIVVLYDRIAAHSYEPRDAYDPGACQRCPAGMSGLCVVSPPGSC
ncbi:MAG: UvrD-helicase domain-containing protein [Actinomycetota bacterium]|nr:UvrD-helicase domain-containing protein [Actinomycetota bacterium]